MAVTMAEITKLRKMTGAGMMDCKNALNEAEGDIDKAMEIIRKKGQAVAAKRSDRDASEGCVLAKEASQAPLTSPTLPQPAPSRARTLEAGKRWARLAQARAASRPGLCALAPGRRAGPILSSQTTKN